MAIVNIIFKFAATESYQPPVLSLPAEGLEIVVGAMLDLTPYVTSSNPVIWSIEPNAFATVSADGKLTGIQAGIANAKITVDDGVA